MHQGGFLAGAGAWKAFAKLAHGTNANQANGLRAATNTIISAIQHISETSRIPQTEAVCISFSKAVFDIDQP